MTEIGNSVGNCGVCGSVYNCVCPTYVEGIEYWWPGVIGLFCSLTVSSFGVTGVALYFPIRDRYPLWIAWCFLKWWIPEGGLREVLYSRLVVSEENFVWLWFAICVWCVSMVFNTTRILSL